MDRLRTYDYLARARQRVFGWIRPLAPDHYTREFPIGRGTIARTLTHVLASEWYYVQRMLGRDVPPYDRWAIREENAPPLAELETVWAEQARQTRSAISSVRDWDRPLEYRITDDDGRLQIVSASPADQFTQLTFHEVHHRAQVLNMLRHLGVVTDDIDFNALMYPRRPAAP